MNYTEFASEKKDWDNLNGKVGYSMTEFTDSELSDELKKRGYKITRLDDEPSCYKSILTWSDGTEILHMIFDRKTEEDALKVAKEQMWKEYDDHNFDSSADEELGAYRGETDCYYIAEDHDACVWVIFLI